MFGQHLRAGNIDAALELVTRESVLDVDNHGNGFVYQFCEWGPDDPEALMNIVRMGADLEFTLGQQKWSPLHQVASSNKPNLVRTLIRLGFPVNILTALKKTPLYFTFKYNETHTDCAIALLDAGANIDIGSRSHRVPIWMHKFVATRRRTRATSIALLGVVQCGANTNGNGKDVFRVIARCVWGMRGIDQTRSAENSITNWK